MSREGSPGNAVTHGLTAKKLLPENLRRQTADLQQQLSAELRPTSVLETILVDELARHGAALKFTSLVEPAVLRRGAASEIQLVALIGSDISEPADVSLCGAVTSEGLEKLTRYRRAHERGFYSALDKLSLLRTNQTFPAACGLRERFATENACYAYLVERRKNLTCARCGSVRGSWLETRNRWACGSCKIQLGVRTGTVMEHSPLPLAAWFAAIITISGNPSVTVAELGKTTGINRKATMKGMMGKILAAASRPSPEAEVLLAGIPQLCVRDGKLQL